jgi:hypothetical protein
MAYLDIEQLEVRIMNVGQGIANVICGYVNNSKLGLLLTYLAIFDCGTQGLTKRKTKTNDPAVSLSATELDYLMKLRAKSEILLHLDNNPQIELQEEPYALVDVFVLSHADNDHYSILETLTRNTKILKHVYGSINCLISLVSPTREHRHFMILPSQESYTYKKDEDNSLISFQEKHLWEIDKTKTSIIYSKNIYCKDINEIITSDYKIDYKAFSEEENCDSFYLHITFNDNEYNYININIHLKENNLPVVFTLSYRCISPTGYEVYIVLSMDEHGNPVLDANPFCQGVIEGEELLPLLLYSFIDVYSDILMNTPQKEGYGEKLKSFIEVFEGINIASGLYEDIKTEEINCMLTAIKIDPFPSDSVFLINQFFYPKYTKQHSGGDQPSWDKINFFILKSNYIFAFPSSKYFVSSPDNINITCISPPDLLDNYNTSGLNFTGQKGDSTLKNIHSQTVVIEFNEKKFVFPGDAVSHTMFWFLVTNDVRYAISDAFLLCAPHHGSAHTSNGKITLNDDSSCEILPLYLNIVNPELHIICIGKDNSYKLPSLEYCVCAVGEHCSRLLNCLEAHNIYCFNINKELAPVSTDKALFTTVVPNGEDDYPQISFVFEFLHLFDGYIFNYYIPGNQNVPLNANSSIDAAISTKVSKHTKNTLSHSDIQFDHKGNSLWI